MTITGNFLTSETHQGVMDIYIASPVTKERLPVVIVLQEAFRVNSHIRDICQRLASEGFLAASPDLYHREGRKIVVDYQDRKEMMPLLGKLTNHGIIQDVRATINFLDDLSAADTQHVSTLGFCIGGFASVLSASKLRIEKMISFYGGGMIHAREGLGLAPILTEMSSIKSKCLFFFGGKDVSIPPNDIALIEKKLISSKVKYEVVVYPLSDHGFFCNERSAYDPDSAANAWIKTVNFLKNN